MFSLYFQIACLSTEVQLLPAENKLRLQNTTEEDELSSTLDSSSIGVCCPHSNVVK